MAHNPNSPFLSFDNLDIMLLNVMPKIKSWVEQNLPNYYYLYTENESYLGIYFLIYKEKLNQFVHNTHKKPKQYGIGIKMLEDGNADIYFPFWLFSTHSATFSLPFRISCKFPMSGACFFVLP